jgi:hypothetical protein
VSTFSLPDAVLDALPLKALSRLVKIFLPGSRHFSFTNEPDSMKMITEDVSGLAQKRSHHGGKHAVVPTIPPLQDLEAAD